MLYEHQAIRDKLEMKANDNRIVAGPKDTTFTLFSR